MNASLLFLQAHSAEFWGVLVIRLRTRGIGTSKSLTLVAEERCATAEAVVS